MEIIAGNEVTDGRKSKNAKYDWPEWIRLSLEEDKAIVLTQGEDFFCTVHSFRVYAHSVAKKRALRVRTGVDEKKVTLQFFAQEA